MIVDEPKVAAGNEVDIAFSGPAIATNKFFVTVHDTFVRVTFTEQAGPDSAPLFRSAVVMSRADAYSLGELLLRLVGSEQSTQTHE